MPSGRKTSCTPTWRATCKESPVSCPRALSALTRSAYGFGDPKQRSGRYEPKQLRLFTLECSRCSRKTPACAWRVHGAHEHIPYQKHVFDCSPEGSSAKGQQWQGGAYSSQRTLTELCAWSPTETLLKLQKHMFTGNLRNDSEP